MSNEIRILGSLSWARDGMAQTLASLGAQPVNQSGQNWIHNRQIVGTSQEPLLLGEVVPARGWIFIRNLDLVNYVSVKPSSSGAALVNVDAQEFAMFRFHTAVTVPQVQADTAPVVIEYLLLQG